LSIAFYEIVGFDLTDDDGIHL